MFRIDISLMLSQGENWVMMDPHYRATLGLFTGYRVQCEFEAQTKVAVAAEPSLLGTLDSGRLRDVTAQEADRSWSRIAPG